MPETDFPAPETPHHGSLSEKNYQNPKSGQKAKSNSERWTLNLAQAVSR
jgi:hypothetical protein